MELNKGFSLETSGILAYYVYNKLQNSQVETENTESENIELPAIKEATLREDGVTSIESVKRMSEIIAEQAKKYAAAVRSGLRTPILVENEQPIVEDNAPITEIVEQPEEPVVDEVQTNTGIFDGTEENVFEQPILTDDVEEPTSEEDVGNDTPQVSDMFADSQPTEEVAPDESEDSDWETPVLNFTNESDDTEEPEITPSFVEEEDVVKPITLPVGPVVDETPDEVDEAEDEEWDCPYCGAKVKGYFCPECGTNKPAKAEDEAPVLNIASVTEEDVKPQPLDLAGLQSSDEKKETAAPTMEAVEELHKVDAKDEDGLNEYASIADFLKSL